MAAGAPVRDGLRARAGALRAFADAAFAAAERAVTEPAADVLVAPGGVPVRVRIRGAEHARRLLPALAPLTAASGARPEIDLIAFDGDLPRPPWGRGDYRPRDELRGYGDEELEVAYNLVGETLSLVDVPGGRALSWSRDPSRLPVWDTGAPLRTPLRWALRGRRRHLVHAAVVGDARGGVLLAGMSGSGKSTTALACALAGLGFTGDDFCVVEPGTPPVAHALYAIAKVDDAALALLPGLGDRVVWDERTPEGKTLVAPGAIARALPLRAIVLPHVGTRTGPLQPAVAAQALLALAPSTLIQLPGSRPVDHAAIAELARALPVFLLELGPDPAAVVAAVRGVLEDVA